MFVNIPIFKIKLRNLFLKLFNTIENNGDCIFESNGEKVFLNNLLQLFKNEKGSKIVFDIGANTGEYSKMIESQSHELNIDLNLHIFEPTRSCFSKVSTLFQNKENITLNNFGVSNQNKKAIIYYDKEESGLASLYKRNLESYDLKLDKSEEIELKRLDEYIEVKSIKHIDFIKIDIEGHELKAFEGFGKYLDSNFIDYIQFEYGGANLDSHTSLMEIYKFLNDRGFKIAKILPYGLELRDYEPFMENFNYANYVAISEMVLKN